jgi:oxygen-dependent protoporphyrinogen oxidase
MQDIVVLGAGIAGLAAAWELKSRGLRPLVLEQQSRAGGVIVTERADGFVIDGGPDSLLSQKLAASELLRDLGLESRLIHTLPPRTAFVLKSGRLVPLPEGSFLGLPTRMGPFVRTSLFSWPAKVRMALEAVAPPKRGAADESIGSFIRRHFGDEAVRYLAEPLLAGIHAGDVEQLSVHALFPRLVDAEGGSGSVLRTLSNAPPARPTQGAFVSFPGGIRELVDALVKSLGDGAIEHNSTVTRIDGLSSPFTVTLSSGSRIQTRALIVAVPAWVTASILRPVEPAIAKWCGEIPYASSATIAFAFDASQVRRPMLGTGFVIPRRERRALMAVTWISSKWPNRAPSGQVLLRGFLGGVHDPDVVKHSDYELTDRAFEELASLMDISGAPSFTRIYRWPDATPQYNVGHLERVRQIDERLAAMPGLFLTGSAYRGTGIPDCIADARTTAAKAAALLATGQTV